MKRIINLLLGVLCLCASATLVADEPTDKSADEATLKKIQDTADQGDPRAMYALGRHYLVDAVPPDREKALQWFMKSAEKGDVDAMYSVGYYYVTEEHPDYEKAFPWFLKSAEKGNDTGAAAVAVANCYYYGLGVEKNVKEGVKWMKVAVKHHAPDAMYFMGYHHITGEVEGIDKDPREAYRLLKAAARLNHCQTCSLLGTAYLEDCDWENADPIEKQRVVSLMTRAANQGDPHACWFLAALYLTEGDEFIPQDKKLSFEWFSKLTKYCEEQKNKPGMAMAGLGDCYMRGNGCDVDFRKGIDCYMKYGKPDYQRTMLQLACVFLVDGVVAPDNQVMLEKMEKTVKWLKEFQEEESTLAKTLLDAGYESGKTTKEDVQKIAENLQAKADRGDPDAMYLLFVFSYLGVGGERNDEKCVEYLKKAAQQNHAESELRLGFCYFLGFTVKRNFEESNRLQELSAEHGSREGKMFFDIQKRMEELFKDFHPNRIEMEMQNK